MNGLNNGASIRHIYYNYYSTAPGTPGGIQVSDYRSGYCTMDMTANNIPVAFYHCTYPAPTDSTRGTCGWDSLYLANNFLNTILPFPSTNRGMVWPHGVVDHQGYYHMVTQTNPNTSIYYSRSQNAGLNWTPWEIMTGTTGMAAVSHTMAASPVSNKVAIVYTHPLATNVYQSDVFYFESVNGTTWNFATPTNITNFATPGHPMQSSTRAYGTCHAIYDNSDNLHIAYTTVAYPTYNDAAIIWHWSANTGHSKVTGELTFSGPYAWNDPGNWHTCWDLPTMGIDATTGRLFMTWEQCTTPGDSSQFSATDGYGNFEVYVCYSDDNGESWMAPVNVTNTHTPLATAGNCMSEGWPTMAKKVNDYLHIEYIQDKDAGGIVQSEGTWTLNPVIYQKVPVDSIETNIVITLIPVNPPIVIPPTGGTFSYNVTIHNASGNEVVFDVWTMVELPNGNIFGPLILRNLMALPAGGSIIRALSQAVPAGAPAGTYEFFCEVGDYGWNTWESSSFFFAKAARGFEGKVVDNWDCYGWEGEVLPADNISAPESYSLLSVYPNPFNPSAEINYTMEHSGMIKLAVYDISGKEVAVLVDGFESNGTHTITFDAGNLASGVYFFTLNDGTNIRTVKSMLLK
jgi:hypothetical protein